MKNSIRSVLSAVVMAALAACAGSAVKPVEMPDSTNVAEEVNLLRKELGEAQSRQADVLSPKNFEHAQDKFMDAKTASEKGADGREDALKALGWSRGYLRAANETTTTASRAVMEVVAAREDALKANAQAYQSKQLKDADSDLRDWGEDFENGKAEISLNDRKELQNKYLDIELNSIKTAKLDPARSRIEAAKKKDAKKLSPQTLAEAERAYATAEATILTDRHDSARIDPAVAEANASSERLLKIMGMAANTKRMSAEEIALAEEAARKRSQDEIARKQDEIKMKDQEIEVTQDRLTETSSTLDKARSANARLNDRVARERSFELALENARQRFSPEEAEVYRQGDKLLIRLKGLGFPSGKADIPAQNLPLLTKVKDVIDSLGAQSVTVEGHTDAVGSSTKNRALSETRAEAVANYLVQEEVVDEDRVQTIGYGYEKPIASNKSVQGRAQNRRVDIIVTPEGVSPRDAE